MCKPNHCRFNLMVGLGRSSEESAVPLDGGEVLSLRASRLCRLCAVADQGLQHTDLKPAGNFTAMKMRPCCVWTPWRESPCISLWNGRQINETHVARWASCINDLLPAAGSLCNFMLLLQGEISRRECDSSQCFAVCLGCLVAQGLRFFVLIFKVPRGLHPRCIFELLIPCIPFQSWWLGGRDLGPESFLKWACWEYTVSFPLEYWLCGIFPSRAQMCDKFSIFKNMFST